MKKQISNEHVREFLAMAKRVTPYLTEPEFETLLRLYDGALNRLEGEDNK